MHKPVSNLIIRNISMKRVSNDHFKEAFLGAKITLLIVYRSHHFLLMFMIINVRKNHRF